MAEWLLDLKVREWRGSRAVQPSKDRGPGLVDRRPIGDHEVATLRPAGQSGRRLGQSLAFPFTILSTASPLLVGASAAASAICSVGCLAIGDNLQDAFTRSRCKTVTMPHASRGSLCAEVHR
jgi:hypothetical protein